MGNLYIKIFGGVIFETLIIKPLKYIIPKANPDFEGKISDVTQWLLEFQNDNEIPCREIGLDGNGQPIMIMPWNDNYGYWTDNNLRFDDFKSGFDTQIISKEEFDECWKSYVK